MLEPSDLLNLVVMQGKKHQVDIHLKSHADLLKLIVLEIEVLKVFKDFQILNLGAHIQKI